MPILAPYGQAFKDNGYRMKNGTDDLRANEPGYWPAFAWRGSRKRYSVNVFTAGGAPDLGGHDVASLREALAQTHT